jgi:MFS family permease
MNLLETARGRRLLFCALYASEGAPIGYVWWALPTKLRAAGVPVERVTQITALLVLPWAFKFLWAPMIDTLRSRRWGLRHWTISAQIAMGLALVPLFTVPIAESLTLVTACLFAHAVLAATQDASIDALCISTVPEHERGSVNGWMQLGMLSTRAIFGGAVLYLEQFVGEAATLVALVACVWFSMLLVLFCTREPVQPASGPGTLRRFASLLAGTLARSSTWMGLGFAATAGAGFEAVGAVAHSFLIDQAAAKEQVGLFYAIPVIVCMSLGALLGGRASDRWGRAATTVAALTAIAGAVIVVGALYGTGLHSAYGGLALLYVLIGAFTAASYALLMDMTEPALGATQFSAFMGATNLCESWAALTAGLLVARMGYTSAFICMALFSLVAIPLALGARRDGE